MKKTCDFSGYATKNDLKCSDGRTIRKNAFKENDGDVVPLVFQHVHNEPGNVLGHAILENREDGVYCYGFLNETQQGKDAKEYIRHGDITSLSIYANKLVQEGGDVIHGMIREVSLVLAGANPGAKIDNVCIAHSDGWHEELDDEAVISLNIELDNVNQNGEMTHAEGEEPMDNNSEPTVQDVLDGMTEEQKQVVYFLIGEALRQQEEGGEASHSDVEDADAESEVSHSDLGEDEMKENVFDQTATHDNTISHSEMEAIFTEAKDNKASLKETFLAHGITNIDYLFPEAKNVTTTPTFIRNDNDWVSKVMGAVKKSPFSRIKAQHANITMEEARAKGYIKGEKKVDEQFSLLTRDVGPQTIYKKQSLDRDDVIDIIDFDVVAWLKQEMREMLEEEVARAILVGDGRSTSSPDKIKETNIIPVYKDAGVYTIKRTLTVSKDEKPADKASMLIDEAVRARVDYKGSGNPTLYIGPAALAEMLLIKDSMGRRIYESESALATAMRVSNIVDIPVFDEIKRTDDDTEYKLAGIIVNLKDYTLGTNKGGQTTMFDDFDIDYNKMKYLLETRLSGMLTVPYSAVVFEYVEDNSQG